MDRELHGTDNGADWRAVLDRDGRFDGRFVYGVRSTGVYCKPSCAARRPRREQAVFFDSCDSAERARFRACRRCLPGQAGGARAEIVRRACGLIESRSGENLSRADLGAALGVSPGHLQRTLPAARDRQSRLVETAEFRRVIHGLQRWQQVGSVP